MYHTRRHLSLRGEGEQELQGSQDTVGFTPHICKGNRDEDCDRPPTPPHMSITTYWPKYSEALRHEVASRSCSPCTGGNHLCHQVNLGA